MAFSRLPNAAADFVLGISDDRFVVLLMISLVFIFLGMFVDSVGIMLLVLPVIMPLLKELNIDLIWFGIITIKLLEIGLITPPVGLNVYVVRTALGNEVSLPTIFKGAAWFMPTDLVVLLLIVAFPIISLWLPGVMMD